MNHRKSCLCDDCCKRTNKAHEAYTREYEKWIFRIDKKEDAHELAMKEYRRVMK